MFKSNTKYSVERVTQSDGLFCIDDVYQNEEIGRYFLPLNKIGSFLVIRKEATYGKLALIECAKVTRESSSLNFYENVFFKQRRFYISGNVISVDGSESDRTFRIIIVADRYDDDVVYAKIIEHGKDDRYYHVAIAEQGVDSLCDTGDYVKDYEENAIHKLDVNTLHNRH